jgi:hypothetical protein
MVSVPLQRIFGGAHRSSVYLKKGAIWLKFTLIAGVETSAFAAAEDRMSDFLGMARISVVFGTR